MTEDPDKWVVASTVMQVGEPLTQDGFDLVCSLLDTVEAVREAVGGEGHDNLGERVRWALTQARGEKPH